MDKFERKVILWTAVVLISFLAALLYATNSRKADLPDCVPYSAAFKNPHLKQIDSTTYELFMVAKMWSFEPAEITIPEGSDVDIYLSSQDVVHGFLIEDKAVNMMAVPGAIGKQTVHFKKAGTYKILCHEYCGVGHQNMESQIIVTPKK
jgi:cytochrome c oxidase subunit II